MFVDKVMMKVMKKLGLEIPEYDSKNDPTKKEGKFVIEWMFAPKYVKEIQGQYLKAKPTIKRKLKKDKTFVKKEESEEIIVKE